MQATHLNTKQKREDLADFLPINSCIIRFEFEVPNRTPTLGCLDIDGEVFLLRKRRKTVRELYSIEYPTQAQLGHLIHTLFIILFFIFRVVTK